MPKVFFATDLHGSQVCWRFLLTSRTMAAEPHKVGGSTF
jgi:hypothetical protein